MRISTTLVIGLLWPTLCIWPSEITAQPSVPLQLDDSKLPEISRAQASTGQPLIANLGQLTDAGNQYPTPGGGKVRLLRSADEVAVRYTGQTSPEEGLRRLRAIKGLDRLDTAAKARFGQRKEIVILRNAGGLNHETVAGSPDVEFAYPVLVDPESMARMVPTDKVLVRLAEGVKLADALKDIADAGMHLVEPTGPPVLRTYLLRLTNPKVGNALIASAKLARSPGVVWAEPNFIREMQFHSTPNDPLFSQQQHLHNTGQNGGVVDADIDAPEAWDTTTGSSSVVIAIIDDAIDTTHTDLNIYHNPGESGGGKETNGIDDDGNGKIDDYRGWDFAGNDNNPNPVGTNGHGTGTAGVAGAIGNNAIRAAGVAYGCKVLPVKVADDSGTFSTNQNIGNAITYAANYADVLSNSWGGGISSSFINNAIDHAVTSGRGGKGAPVFFSTGNAASTWYSGGSRRRLSMEGLSGSYYFAFYYKRGGTSAGEEAFRIDNVCLIDADGYTHKTAVLPRQDFEGSFPPAGWSLARSGGASADWFVTATNAYTGCGGTLSARSPTLSVNQYAYLFTPLMAINGTETLAFATSVSTASTSNCYVLIYDSTMTYTGSGWNLGTGVPIVTTSVSYPANYTNSIAVGASTDCDFRANYSQYASNLEFVASSNGGWNDIVTLDPVSTIGWTDTDYKTNFGGTSTACPVAAGVAALLISSNSNLTLPQIKLIMRKSCDHIGGVAYSGGDPCANGWNQFYGYGRVNAAAALAILNGGAPPVAPTGLDLAAADDTGSLNSDNVTSQTTNLTISGSAEACSTVQLFDGAAPIGPATAAASFTSPGIDISLASGTHSITAKATNVAGIASAASSILSITIDTTAPIVAGVSSNTADGCYTTGSVVDVRVSFAESVNVTGAPQITLNTMPIDRAVNYSSGSGSGTLVFNYTVQAGDSSTDLDYLSTTSLVLNGGTIRDTAGNNAVLTLANPGAAGSLGASKNIVIHNIAAPTGASASPAAVCFGQSTTLSATPGSGGNQVQWFTASCGGTLVGIGNQTVSPTQATTYFARTNNSSTNCTSTTCTSVSVTVNSLPSAPTSPAASPATICSGASSTLSATAGSGGDQVQWFTGSCGGTLVGTSPQAVSPTTTTTYFARTRNSSSTCTSTGCATASVTVNPLPGSPNGIAASPASICTGSSSTISVTDLGPGLATDWYTGSCGGTAVAGGAGVNSVSVSPTATTTYFARTRNSSTGCNSSSCDSVSIAVNPLPGTPTGAAAIPTTICSGQSSTLSATAGSGGDQVQWFTGSCGGTLLGTGNQTLAPTATTTYYARTRNSSTSCTSSSCVAIAVTMTDCDDGSACTADACDPQSGCTHTAISCDDSISCTADSCDSVLGCQHTPNNGLCNDNNPCTDDVCDAQTGCVHTPNNASCDDGVFCTVNDVCSNSSCSGTPRNCDDGVACTVDSCNDQTDQCDHTPNDALCDDGNPGTQDSCDPVNGCQHVFLCAAPVIQSAISIRTHGAAGDFGIPLGIAPSAGQIECRQGGPTRIEVTFGVPIVPQDGSLDAGDEVTITSNPIGAINITGLSIIDSLLRINLNGIPDRSCVAVTIQKIACDAGGGVPAAVMIPTTLQHPIVLGDVNGDGMVSSADRNAAKAATGTSISTNFREDVTANGRVSTADLTLIESKLNGVTVNCP